MRSEGLLPRTATPNPRAERLLPGRGGRPSAAERRADHQQRRRRYKMVNKEVSFPSRLNRPPGRYRGPVPVAYTHSTLPPQIMSAVCRSLPASMPVTQSNRVTPISLSLYLLFSLGVENS